MLLALAFHSSGRVKEAILLLEAVLKNFSPSAFVFMLFVHLFKLIWWPPEGDIG